MIPDLGVVIPAYNSGIAVSSVVEGAVRHAAAVVVVDDGSTDKAVDKALAPFEDEPRVRLVRFPKNRGKGHALIMGFRALLEGPALSCAAVLDADGQHDPAELPRLHGRFQAEEADLLIGARTFEGPGVPWASVAGNRATRWVTRTWLDWDLPDTQSGYRLHSRRLLDGVVAAVSGGRYETEMEILVMALAGDYRVCSEPIRTIYEHGNPTSHFRKVSDSVRIYARLYRAVGRWRRKAS